MQANYLEWHSQKNHQKKNKTGALEDGVEFRHFSRGATAGRKVVGFIIENAKSHIFGGRDFYCSRGWGWGGHGPLLEFNTVRSS